MLPQALRAVYPSLGNQFIQTVLASSIGSVIGAPELTQQINFIDSRPSGPIELLAFLTLAYAVLTLVLSLLVRAVWCGGWSGPTAGIDVRFDFLGNFVGVIAQAALLTIALSIVALSVAADRHV